MAWARPDNRHSRVVFWLKILLPLGALAILSTLFTVSHNIRPEDAIPYAEVNIADLVNEPRLTAPDFAGMTSDGAALSLKAAEARPGTPDSANAGQITDLNGLLQTPDGASTTLVAEQARLDQVAHVAILAGNVRIRNSLGYSIETQEISVALDQTKLDSDGPITAIGPVGQISANSMHLGLAEIGGKDYVLVFTGDVRVIYTPTQQEAVK
jgi:lipopolysaccharide export system protein LptC